MPEQRDNAAEYFLDSVIENIPDMVFVKDVEELRFIRLNRAGEELLGFPREQFIGKNDYDFFPPAEADFFTRKDREVLANKQLLDIPAEPIQTRDRGTRILHTKKIPILDEHGNALYLLGISEDITDRVEVGSQLERARQDAEAANRAKNEFLSRMSHELRTPLNAIIGFAQVLQMDQNMLTVDESVGQILRAGRHLLDLINEVLDISRIETGSFALVMEEVEAHEAVSEAIAMMKPLAGERRVELFSPGDTDGKRLIVADKGRLRQVLLNLLSNAIKYNQEYGRVEVEITTDKDESGQTWISMCVADTGAGIPSEQLDRLFIPFDRLGAELSDVQGTGLGLAVSKRLVETMGGSIDVKSAYGEGSTFTLRLPEAELGVAETVQFRPPKARVMHVPNDSPATVLYIEDNASNVALVEAIFISQVNLRLVVARDGAEGIVLARDLKPALILLDLHLPDIQGDEVLRRLRQDPETEDIAVAIVSADATHERIDELRSLGAVDYVTKPFDIDRLLDLVNSYVTAPS